MKTKRDYFEFYDNYMSLNDSRISHIRLTNYFEDCDFRDFTIIELCKLGWRKINNMVLIPIHFEDSITFGTKVRSIFGTYHTWGNNTIGSLHHQMGFLSFGLTQGLIDDYIIEERDKIIDTLINT
jgi:hypothetical protein